MINEIISGRLNGNGGDALDLLCYSSSQFLELKTQGMEQAWTPSNGSFALHVENEPREALPSLAT
jgi:hypothetical protein